MFKGTTTLQLNNATMIEALQEYLERRTGDEATAFKVTSVVGDGMAQIFTVTIEEKTTAAS